jgi:hypothetical protein
MIAAYCLIVAGITLLARKFSCPCFCTWKWNRCPFCNPEEEDNTNGEEVSNKL